MYICIGKPHMPWNTEGDHDQCTGMLIGCLEVLLRVIRVCVMLHKAV